MIFVVQSLTFTLTAEFVAAHNLVIHLIQPSSSVSTHLQPLCASITRDASSPTKAGLALTVLSTVFNTLATDDSIRYPVFNAILDVISRSSASGSFDALRPQLKHLESWLSSWNTPAPQARKLYLRIASIATEAGENEDAYEFLIRALRTIPSEEVSNKEARDLSIDALKAALVSPTHFDFEDLTSLDSVQALRNSDDSAASTFFELLEIFTSQLLEDYVAFKSEHGNFVSEQDLDDAALTRKMRLLTLASIASSAGQSRSLPYSNIASSLQIEADDVEMWVIDVIRAGLVEGKLSQQKQIFLIHRSTYRVFGDQQWREVAGRLDMWRSSLVGVLGVIRQEKAGLIAQKERELREVEAKVNGSGGGYRRNQQREAIDVGLD